LDSVHAVYIMDKLLIMDEKWDHLIVLDACRYDYFKRVYKRYFTGELSKRTSVASTTAQWIRRSFKGTYDDIIYISSNPYMNSIREIHGYKGCDHFFKVVDLWKDGWDDGKGTVLPETVTDSAIDMLEHYHGKRLIAHYLQPHSPYLGLDSKGFPTPDIETGNVLMDISDKKVKPGIRRRVLEKSRPLIKRMRFLGHPPLWKVNEFLLMEPMCPMDDVRRRYGVEVLKEHYMVNLHIVLSEVSNLLEHLSGTVVITGDHGEFLGERGNFGHGPYLNDPILLTVPWLVIESEASQRPTKRPVSRRRKVESADDEIVLKRLRDLGYFEV